MRGTDFVAMAIRINDAASEQALCQIEERLRAAELAGEADTQTCLRLEELAQRRHARDAHEESG